MIWSIIVGGLIGWLAGAIGLVARNSLGSFLIGLGGTCVVILVCRWLFK